jgi:hypothetical protein
LSRKLPYCEEIGLFDLQRYFAFCRAIFKEIASLRLSDNTGARKSPISKNFAQAFELRLD